MTEPEDQNDLPPTQYLVMEVLAARYRLGHHGWCFPTKVTPALDALVEKGYLWYKSWVTPKTLLVFLTEDGKKTWLSEDYVPPILEK